MPSLGIAHKALCYYISSTRCTIINHRHVSLCNYNDIHNRASCVDSAWAQSLPVTLSARYLMLSTEYDSRLIHKHRLYNVETMLKKNRYFVTKHNSPVTLAQRLARRAVFGDDCLIQCTPLVSPIYLALPQKELFNLQTKFFFIIPSFMVKTWRV